MPDLVTLLGLILAVPPALAAALILRDRWLQSKKTRTKLNPPRLGPAKHKRVDRGRLLRGLLP